MAMNKNKNKIIDSDSETMNSFNQLINNIHMLYDSKEGCPWHRSQTNETLIPYLIEENNELIEALLEGNKKNIKEELGDVLLQIMLHSEISSKNNGFVLKDVINNLNKKIIFRHPYIFSEKKKISIKEANEIWKNQKEQEKKSEKDKINSNLSFNIKKTSPMVDTQSIAFELDKIDICWNNSDDILEKLIEEIEELKEAITEKNHQNIKEEFGDIFFTLLNLSYFLKLNHQDALNSANEKFLKRISAIEEIIGDRITRQSVNDFQNLWKLAKTKLQSSKNKK